MPWQSWKANGKTTTLLFFLDGLFPKTKISYMRDAFSGDKIMVQEAKKKTVHMEGTWRLEPTSVGLHRCEASIQKQWLVKLRRELENHGLHRK